MPELDWLHDILPDKDRFPDTMQWPIDQAGNTVSLGTLRQAVVPSTQYAALERTANDRYQALMREKAALDRQLVERLSVDPPSPATTPGVQNLEDLYNGDPVLAPIWRAHKASAEELGTVKSTMTKMEKLLNDMQAWPGQMATILKTQQIQARDANLKPTDLFAKASELAQRAAQPGGILDDAYTLLTLDQKMAAAKAEGERLGREAAQAEWAAQQAQAPFMPSGAGSVLVPQDAPKFSNDQQLLAGLMQDIDLQRIWAGQLDSLPAVA